MNPWVFPFVVTADVLRMHADHLAMVKSFNPFMPCWTSAYVGWLRAAAAGLDLRQGQSSSRPCSVEAPRE